MSLSSGPDHPTTTLNADELVAMTTGQPQRARGYSSSGVMVQRGVYVNVCVCVWGDMGLKGFGVRERSVCVFHDVKTCKCCSMVLYQSYVFISMCKLENKIL